MAMQLKIDRDLRALLPPLSKEERELLKRQIAADGCQDSIKVWKEEGVIVDGHNRYEICRELQCEFNVKELSFADKGAAAEWMVTFQEGRRNMTPAAISAARGMAYNFSKKTHGGSKDSKGKSSRCQVGNLKTAEKIAKETGVSPRTVHRDGKFQEALAKLSTKARETILAGKIPKPSHGALERLSEYDAPSQMALLNAVESNEYVSLVAALNSQEEPAKPSKPQKPPKPPKGKPQKSAAQVCDRLTKLYIAPLARELLALAQMTGGPDRDYELAHEHLDNVLQYVKGKRK